MGANTAIEWCDHTFNPWIGCTRISEGCRNCYAEAIGRRFGFAEWGHGQARRPASEKMWGDPLAWNRAAAKAGRRARVFCASLADVFDPAVPDDWRDRLFALAAVTPALDWLLLTKRPRPMWGYLVPRDTLLRIDRLVADALGGVRPSPPPSWPLRNVWLGVSVEDQAAADARVPILLDTPAAVRFVSCEPLLGAVELAPWLPGYCPTHDFDSGLYVGRCPDRRTDGLDWVIAGGESGPAARPMHPDWARGLRAQCVVAVVPFFFKQWGEWVSKKYKIDGARDAFFWPPSADGLVGPVSYKVGKKRAGRKLDGRLHDDFPSGGAR